MAKEACGEDHSLAVWYTAEAIRQHFSDEDLSSVSDKALEKGAEAYLMNNDPLWGEFDRACREILEYARKYK